MRMSDCETFAKVYNIENAADILAARVEQKARRAVLLK